MSEPLVHLAAAMYDEPEEKLRGGANIFQMSHVPSDLGLV